MSQTETPNHEKQPRSWLRRHHFLALLLVNLGLFVGVVVVFEIGLRAFTPDWLSNRMDFLAAGGAPDTFGTDGSWKTVQENGSFVSFVPHSSFDVIHAEYQTTAIIDDLGGRKLDPPALSAGKFIGCIGDSFTFGIGVKNGETFIDHLQGDSNVRLVNLGVPGSALTTQRFIVEQRHSELGQPPLYLQFFFLGNDFADILKSANSLSNPQAEPLSPKRDPSGWLKLSYKLNTFINNGWLRHMYVLQFLKRAVMNATGDKRKNPIYDMMDVNSVQYHENVRKVLTSEIAKWKALAREKGFHLVIVFVPDCYQLDDERRRLQAKYYGIDYLSLDPLLPNQILSACLDGQKIPYIDATSDLIGLPDVTDLYYVNDHHFTAQGHVRFAKAIADKVKTTIKTSLSE